MALRVIPESSVPLLEIIFVIILFVTFQRAMTRFLFKNLICNKYAHDSTCDWRCWSRRQLQEPK